MAIANFTFLTSTGVIVDTVQVNLINSAACRAWQYAVMLNQNTRSVKNINGIKPRHNTDLSSLVSMYDELVDYLHQLNNTQFTIKETIPEKFDQTDQAFYNRIHRHFTTSVRKLWSEDSQIKANELNKINDVLEKINLSVHQLESSCLTPAKELWGDTIKELWIKCPGYGYDINPFRDCHSLNHADLIMDCYILGKTLIQSFFCSDNPTAIDTCGHRMTNGGACFLLSNSREQIYRSPEFSSWLDKFNTNTQQVYGDISLGNLASGHKVRLTNIFNLIKNNDVEKLNCTIDIVV
jgi:hypothetical protein